jgi:hypothetical protein
MPYIKQVSRKRLKSITEQFKNNEILSAGELNYLITTMINSYLNLNGENYQNYNDILGALEGAKLELYRRQIQSYEDKKITENGDVQ